LCRGETIKDRRRGHELTADLPKTANTQEERKRKGAEQKGCSTKKDHLKGS